MYMTYDIVCSYRIRHRMYIRCRMSTYDIVCLTYDVVRLLEVVVSAVLKQADPLPTAHANDLCHSDSKSFIFSLATSMTVSETRSLWCSSTLKTALVAVHRHRLLTSQVCRLPLCMSESFTAPILVLQDNFRCHPRGWRRGCYTCYGCTYPLKPGVGVAKTGLSSNRFCLNGLAGGNRGGPCTRRFQHTSTLSLGVWPRVGVARVVRAQSASQVSHPSSEKSCNLFETQVECNTRCR
jgi:hypothetical protein